MQMVRAVRLEIFRNKRTPFEEFPFFRSNRMEQKFPFHLRNSVSAGVWRLEFPIFAGERSRTVAVFFLFISYLIVQNGICTSVARTLGGFSLAGKDKE